jgi:hypothetical protein
MLAVAMILVVYFRRRQTPAVWNTGSPAFAGEDDLAGGFKFHHFDFRRNYNRAGGT